MTRIKICGINDLVTLQSVIENGADFVGFVFAEESPRAVTKAQAASLWNALSDNEKQSITPTGLFVDADIPFIQSILDDVPLKLIQLHGEEPPEFITELKTITNISVMKAIRIRDADDLKKIHTYQKVSDWLLLDSKTEGQQGGTGHSFDWSLLQNTTISIPWMLAGGLTSDNVMQAILDTTPAAVDVSSGVEIKRGQKSTQKIADFIAAAKQKR